MLTTKACRRCMADKSVGDFHRSAVDSSGFQSYCKPCQNEHKRQKRLERGWVPRKPRPKQPRPAVQLKHTHRISLEDKHFMWLSQGGRCAVCGTPTASERGMHIDHDHSAGCGCPEKRSCAACRRGLLCGLCNRMLGHAHDSLATLTAAVTYLGSHYGS